MGEGFDDYVRARGDALARFAFVLSGDRHLAQDLVQEALARCHRRWARIQRAGSPEPYVRKAILRVYLSWLRRRSSTERPVAEVPETAASPAGAPDAAETLAHRDALWAQLAALPRKQRAVLVLRYYEDLGDDHIAELLGCAPTTVRVHASRGLARLRTNHSTNHTPSHTSRRALT